MAPAVGVLHGIISRRHFCTGIAPVQPSHPCLSVKLPLTASRPLLTASSLAGPGVASGSSLPPRAISSVAVVAPAYRCRGKIALDVELGLIRPVLSVSSLVRYDNPGIHA